MPTSAPAKPGDTSLIAPAKPRVFERIVEFLRAEIEAGRLRPGDRLKPERELAAELGVGRGSLREALKTLEVLDVIELRHGLGAYVSLPQPETLSKIFGTLLSMQPGQHDDIMDARIALECQAVRLASRNARTRDINRMRLALSSLQAEAVSRSGEQGAQADHEFHSAIMEATGNATFVFLYSAITSLLKRSHHERWLTLFCIEESLHALNRVHQEIFECILEGDEDRAAAAMAGHFRIIAEILADHATTQGGQPIASIAFRSRPGKQRRK
ncbi:FadR/GntR family transcriptional regulator [Enterovirga sp. CN4-39]|uniref:FadR/GntR family transcriptional regulator n=1 Tax=Enterovirga sp. CN4-39 TaxID=3400910 RepID=UPI003C040E7C